MYKLPLTVRLTNYKNLKKQGYTAKQCRTYSKFDLTSLWFDQI